ncbi:MAG: phosphate propanoyltransferase [Clostridiales bacterium]|nr:phosphate propanoyltransferase [Clostridiales bacterium]
MNVDEKYISEIVEKVVRECVSGKTISSDGDIPVGVSNRHIHLTQEHVEVLFGKGYQLTPLKDLSQPGQYACKEQLTLIGPSLRAIEGVRVLGPVRKQSQVEISKTDSFTLKVKPPVRESGDLAGSAPITIIGPKGLVQLNEGCILANRHIHMSPADGERYGVKDGDYVSVETVGEGKRTKLYDVQIRVSDKFILEMHLDTDDANACGIGNGSKVKLVKD